jgi:hypothetical protein
VFIPPARPEDDRRAWRTAVSHAAQRAAYERFTRTATTSGSLGCSFSQSPLILYTVVAGVADKPLPRASSPV